MVLFNSFLGLSFLELVVLCLSCLLRFFPDMQFPSFCLLSLFLFAFHFWSDCWGNCFSCRSQCSKLSSFSFHLHHHHLNSQLRFFLLACLRLIAFFTFSFQIFFVLLFIIILFCVCAACRPADCDACLSNCGMFVHLFFFSSYSALSFFSFFFPALMFAFLESSSIYCAS